MVMSYNYFNSFSGLFGNSGSTNWYSDWSSIRNGSYKKLMKSYYSNVVDSSGSSTTASARRASSGNILDKILEEKKYPKVSEQVQEANSNLTSGISSLKSSVSTLQSEKTYTDSEDGKTTAADKVVSAMKDYVSKYNDVVSSAKKSTLTRQTSHVAAMMKASETNAGKLSDIGVTINRDGTLQLNESKLKAADLSKVQELFSSDNVMSYGSTVKSRLGFAGASSNTVQSAQKDDETKEDEVEYTGASGLKTDIEKLTSESLFEKIKDEDGSEKYDIDKILEAAKSFAGNYNRMLDDAKSSFNSGVMSNLTQIRGKTAQYKNTLEQFGFSIDGSGKLKLDEDTFKKADMSEVQKFFKNYGSSIATNVSLVNYYMTTQANASNSYTPNGSYYVPGNSAFDAAI